MESRGQLMFKLAQQQIQAKNIIASCNYSIQRSKSENEIVNNNASSHNSEPSTTKQIGSNNTDGQFLQPQCDIQDQFGTEHIISDQSEQDFSADSIDDPLFTTCSNSDSEDNITENESGTVGLDIQDEIIQSLQNDGGNVIVNKKNVRKRPRNPSKWKSTERKLLCQSGKEYTSRRGKLVSARKVKEVPSCSKTCRLKCTSMVSKTERSVIFASFYTLAQNEKKQFLLQQTERALCARKTLKNEAGPSRRNFSFKYFLRIKNEKIHVCKEFFLKTLHISQKMVYHAHFHKTEAYTAKPDGRGKSSGSSRLLDIAIKQKIVEHINSFPVVESHYCRQTTQRKYLESCLNISKMYGLYETLCKEENIQSAKESAYRRVFNTEFNIGFHVPKSDRCDLCEAFNNSVKHNLSITESQKNEYDMHISNKENMRKEREADKSGVIPVLSFDLQNVVTCPRAEISSFFYRRKLNVNLTAKLSLTNQVYCAIWDESLSGRAGNDIASALNKILECVVSENVLTNIILWSDSCVPQNRNSHMSYSIMEFLKDNPEMENLFMKFSIPGHSCIQEIDHVHSLIEKDMRKTEIYSPIGLIRLLKLVNRKQPYKIIQMKRTYFKDYQATSKLFNYKVVPFTKVSTLKFTQCFPEIQYKFSHADIDYQTASIRLPERGHRTRQNEQEESVFVTCKSKTVMAKPVLSTLKLNDIKQMLKFMPPQDAEFYKVVFQL